LKKVLATYLNSITAPIAAVRNFDNQQGKYASYNVAKLMIEDVKTKQHYCPLKQDHPSSYVITFTIWTS